MTDAATGAPLPARIERVEFEPGFVDSESRYASLPHGRFHALLPDWQWTLRFSLEEFDGMRYAPEVRQVQVVNGQTVELDVRLLEEEAK